MLTLKLTFCVDYALLTLTQLSMLHAVGSKSNIIPCSFGGSCAADITYNMHNVDYTAAIKEAMLSEF